MIDKALLSIVSVTCPAVWMGISHNRLPGRLSLQGQIVNDLQW